MPCTRPQPAWYNELAVVKPAFIKGGGKPPNGKGTLLYGEIPPWGRPRYWDWAKARENTDYVTCWEPIKLPCHKCPDCKLRLVSSWGDRISHEAKAHELGCFLTLTYDDAIGGVPLSLNPAHLATFWKSLRNELRETSIKSIKYYACGEYGPHTFRPHYHAAVIGYLPSDRKRWGGRESAPTYTSAELDRLWTHGQVILGTLNPATARYVASHKAKVITRPVFEDVDEYKPDLGYTVPTRRKRTDVRALPLEIPGEPPVLVTPEFNRMSKGIGLQYINNYKSDLLTHGAIVHPGGHKSALPTYYKNKLKITDPERMRELKVQSSSLLAELERKGELTPERLKVREICTTARRDRMRRGN